MFMIPFSINELLFEFDENTDGLTEKCELELLPSTSSSSTMSSYSFSVLPSTFIYTDPSTVLDDLPAVAHDFGLSKETTWQQLLDKIKDLNQQSKDGSNYKLAFVGRHGQGFHSQ